VAFSRLRSALTRPPRPRFERGSRRRGLHRPSGLAMAGQDQRRDDAPGGGEVLSLDSAGEMMLKNAMQEFGLSARGP